MRIALQVAHQALTAVGKSQSTRRTIFAHLRNPAERERVAASVIMVAKVPFCADMEIAQMEQLRDAALPRKLNVKTGTPLTIGTIRGVSKITST